MSSPPLAGRARSWFTGMGGSGVAGDVMARRLRRAARCRSSPCTTTSSRWVGAADLVIAVSCSGGNRGRRSRPRPPRCGGLRLIGSCGENSPLAMIAQQARAPFIGVPSAACPVDPVGLSMPLVVIASRLGLLEAERRTTSLRPPSWSESSPVPPDSESFVNPAKTLALELAGTLR